VSTFSFCPNSLCPLHMSAPEHAWYAHIGCYRTRTFGLVHRYRCTVCRKTFSPQTFSIDYYAKRRVNYADLLIRQASSESVRALSRSLHVSCGTVLNRFDRLARQAAAIHACLRPLADSNESVCVDGFVGFDVSRFFPCEITLAITAGSRFILDAVHATRRRSGTMTEPQEKKASALYSRVAFERGAIGRSFREILDSLAAERAPSRSNPLVLITDEKKDYLHAIHAHPLFRDQDEARRIGHITVNSKLPRTFANPLFASNYLDREIRKDQAAHHRESTCFNRNVANGMSRLMCYIVQHNYRKRYSIKAPRGRDEVHGEIAGIGKEQIEKGLRTMFTEREFLTRIRLPPILERIWKKEFITPMKETSEYLPRFAFG
jgi:hypothetical protein